MKRITLLTLIASTLPLLPGCGGDDASTTTAPAAAQTTPAADADAFARAKGKGVFMSTCFTCHGVDGTGVEGLGKDMTTSEFIASKTNEELVEFVKVGRPLDDPLSDGVAIMPPRGGNPKLTDEDLRNVILYVRSLHK